ncbi:hypothetical protein PGO_041610 [Plasmodium gonderi]|uniref:Uncharacterized protein n=1 Tax=Plasmodium gonderi TaxID=77519 RepID=A0A1Y1JAL1_PLAGO|nr:hypothetical protein PGO_041610 [Plasmodium gonderi]GAW79561.1 hypothetical protein PGO_041610 [Plasmodium gonderi]
MKTIQNEEIKTVVLRISKLILSEIKKIYKILDDIMSNRSWEEKIRRRFISSSYKKKVVNILEKRKKKVNEKVKKYILLKQYYQRLCRLYKKENSLLRNLFVTSFRKFKDQKCLDIPNNISKRDDAYTEEHEKITTEEILKKCGFSFSYKGLYNLCKILRICSVEREKRRNRIRGAIKNGNKPRLHKKGCNNIFRFCLREEVTHKELDHFSEGNHMHGKKGSLYCGNMLRNKISIGNGGEVSGGEVIGGEVSGGEVSGGEVSGGEVSDGKVSGGKVSGGKVSGGEVSDGKESDGKESDGEVIGGEVSGGEVIGGEVSGGEVSGGEVSDGKVSGGKVSGGEVSDGKESDGEVSDGKESDGKESDGEVSDGEVNGTSGVGAQSRQEESSKMQTAMPYELPRTTELKCNKEMSKSNETNLKGKNSDDIKYNADKEEETKYINEVNQKDQESGINSVVVIEEEEVSSVKVISVVDMNI